MRRLAPSQGRPVRKPFAAYEGEEPYVFVCYAHADAGTVYPELSWLRAQGTNIWYDEGISPGSEFPEAVGQAILGASCLLFYASARSVASRHCRDEVYFALDRGVPVLTLRLEPGEMPAGLAMITGTTQALARYELTVEEYRRKLVNAVSTSQEARPAPPRPTAAGKPAVARSATIDTGRRRLRVAAACAALGIATIVAGGYLQRLAEIRHARNELIPQIRSMIDDRWSDYTDPYVLALEAERIIPHDPDLEQIFDITSLKLDITSEPPGADVYLQRYAHPEEDWQHLGRTPLRSERVPVGIFRWRFEKPGYESVEAAQASWNLDLAGARLLLPNDLHRQLFTAQDTPSGMVHVAGTETDTGFVPEFWIDRFEVSNRQFREFVQAGGYTRRELWPETFTDGERVLSWEQAMALFVDQSGRPGPSTWIGGTYPEGAVDHPVAGVSWYEADAYARFRGRSLPTGTHWGLAQSEQAPMIQFPQLGGLGIIAPLSNFYHAGTRPVGTMTAISTWGAYDLAGNVREWCINSTERGRLVRGGSYDDNPYRFIELSQAPALTREPIYGFRTVLLTEAPPEAVYDRTRFPFTQEIDLSSAADDETFDFIKRQFQYDERPLDPRIERATRTDEWTLERILVRAAYGRDDLIINLFLPTSAEPPYQTLLYFPGSGSLFQKSSEDLAEYYEVPIFLSFLIKTGRAVAYPVYQGTFERHDPSLIPIHLGGPPNAYRSYFVQLVQDAQRTLDYLDKRSDIDSSSYVFYGMSWGAIFAAIVPAVEPRIRAAALLGGGYIPTEPPETNPIHYAPRVNVPVLMMVGRYDSMLSFEGAIKPLFEMLGSSTADKTLKVYDTDHVPPKKEFVTALLAWLDETIGPVQPLPPEAAY